MLLRKHFGVGAEEAYTVLPWWEVDVLVQAVSPAPGGTDDPVAAVAREPAPDPFGAVPDDLMGL